VPAKGFPYAIVRKPTKTGRPRGNVLFVGERPPECCGSQRDSIFRSTMWLGLSARLGGTNCHYSCRLLTAMRIVNQFTKTLQHVFPECAKSFDFL